MVTRRTVMQKTPLSEIFRGQLRTRTVKNSENEPTENIEPFFTLKLDIEVIVYHDINFIINYQLFLTICSYYVESKICTGSSGHVGH